MEWDVFQEILTFQVPDERGRSSDRLCSFSPMVTRGQDAGLHGQDGCGHVMSRRIYPEEGIWAAHGSTQDTCALRPCFPMETLQTAQIIHHIKGEEMADGIWHSLLMQIYNQPGIKGKLQYFRERNVPTWAKPSEYVLLETLG